MPQEDPSKILEFVLEQLHRAGLSLDPPPFPEPEATDPHGCVAFSSRLSPDMVLAAYRRGIFPMAEGSSVGWWSPDPRAILDLDAFHVPRRLARTVRQGRFEVRVNTCLPEVIARCADREDKWISPEVEEVYTALHAQGHVHSVETWRDGELAGGLYGVSIGGAFMAESMFHVARDASKVAVVALVERMRARGLVLLDIQYQTDATAIFRPKKIPRADYRRRLARAIELDRAFAPAPQRPPRSGGSA